MAKAPYTRSVRLDEQQQRKLLDDLDRAAKHSAPKDGRDKRRDQRFEFRQSDIATVIEHPGGSVARLLVCARNLSAGGMSFCHGSFLHPQTRCRFGLRTRQGDVQIVRGVVVNCRHVEGSVHEVGVKFDQRIDPTVYLDSTSSSDATQSVAVPELNGRMLLIDLQPGDQHVAHHLRATGAELVAVGTLEQALSKIKGQTFDLVVCALETGTDGLMMLAKTIRAAGFSRSLVMLTAQPDAAAIAAIQAAGANHVLQKPHDPAALYELLSKVHREPVPVAASTPRQGNRKAG